MFLGPGAAFAAAQCNVNAVGKAEDGSYLQAGLAPRNGQIAVTRMSWSGGSASYPTPWLSIDLADNDRSRAIRLAMGLPADLDPKGEARNWEVVVKIDGKVAYRAPYLLAERGRGRYRAYYLATREYFHEPTNNPHLLDQVVAARTFNVQVKGGWGRVVLDKTWTLPSRADIDALYAKGYASVETVLPTLVDCGGGPPIIAPPRQ